MSWNVMTSLSTPPRGRAKSRSPDRSLFGIRKSTTPGKSHRPANHPSADRLVRRFTLLGWRWSTSRRRRLAQDVSCGEGTTPEGRGAVFGRKDLEPGEAVIVEQHVKHHGSDGRNTLFEWLADVTPASGAPFRTVLATPGLALDFREPGPGDHVSVLIDRKKDVTHFDKSDPRSASRPRLRRRIGALPSPPQALPARRRRFRRGRSRALRT
jgi:hypothetical protein